MQYEQFYPSISKTEGAISIINGAREATHGQVHVSIDRVLVNSNCEAFLTKLSRAGLQYSLCCADLSPNTHICIQHEKKTLKINTLC